MARNSMYLFSLLPTSHNYYSGVIRSIPSIMASERLNLPPVPSVARITQPANEDTALFILQSVLKTGAHLPAGKYMNLIKLLWDSPQTQVLSTVSSGSVRQLGVPGTSSCL